MKIVAGGGKKKSEILGGLAEGCPAEGCPAEGCPAKGFPAEGFPAEGCPAEMGAGFGVFGFSSGFLGTKTETEQKQNEER